MDVREKYVMQKVNRKEKSICPNCIHHNLCIAENNQPCFECNRFIDAHGVTVQEWISVKDRLPQENEPEGATCEQVQVLLNNGLVSTGWCNRHTKLWWHLNYGETHFIGYDYEHTPVIAWQPLAQPPKGE